MTSPKSQASPIAMAEHPRVRTLSQTDSPLSGSPGSDANRVRRRSSFGTYTRIVLVAIDVSEHSRYAFEWFLSNVWRSDDLLVLVHCPETPKLPSFTFKSGIAPPVEEWKKIIDEMNTKARKLEEDYEGTCAMKKLKYKTRTEAMKNVGEGLLRIADEENADLIVCGSKSSSGARYTSKGSTAEFIMRNAAIPVVAIPIKH